MKIFTLTSNSYFITSGSNIRPAVQAINVIAIIPIINFECFLKKSILFPCIYTLKYYYKHVSKSKYLQYVCKILKYNVI